MRRQLQYRFFILLALLGMVLPSMVSAQSKDNLGKEFFVVFAKNIGGGTESQNNIALYLSGPAPARGNVEIPALNFQQSFTVVPGQITTVELPSGQNGFGSQTAAVEESEVIKRGMAVHVTADTEITVYGINHKQFSTDAFMGMPVDVLGTEYRAMSYNSSPVGNNPGQSTAGMFWIAAIHDSTTVTITPQAETALGRPANVPFNVTLYRGDAYVVMGDGMTRSNDLTGSLIESDLPIAVFSGHVRTEMPSGYVNRNSNTGSRDHLVEQLPPVSAWGDSALVIPYRSSFDDDLVRIVSAEDDNQITVNGTVVATLQAGQFYQITSLQGPTAIEGTHPILVGQYSHSSEYGTNTGTPYGDPALALVYPVEQFSKSYTFISIENADFSGNFFNIVVSTAGAGQVRLDGVLISQLQFAPIPGSGYMYAQVAVNQGTHNVTCPEPFGITVYGLGGVDSYAYTGGTLLKTITPFKTRDLVIDFGDRPLDPVDLSGTWDTTVAIENISSDPLTISQYIMRSGDANNFWVDSSRLALTIPSSAVDSMTIIFDPKRIPDIRRRSTINARTEHLRAYVVDVLGRGVVAKPMSYADSASTMRIDTIYFGFFGENSPPADTVAYIANSSLGILTLDKLSITGPNAADFSVTGVVSRNNAATMPFVIDTSLERSAQVGLRFTPGSPRAPRLAYLDINESHYFKRRVVLLANVDTIELASVTSTPFDSLFICEVSEEEITIRNTNTFDVKVTGMTFTPANQKDFVILTPLPLNVPPNSTRTVRVRFVPRAPGHKSATATLTFDIPTNGKQVVTLAGYAKLPVPGFWAPKNIHILPGEEVMYPIYARTDLSKQQSATFTIDLNYDPSNIIDVDVSQENTLTQGGYYLIYNSAPGSSQYEYHSVIGNLTGGGEAETRPLVYIKFKSSLAEGENMLTFTKAIDINFAVKFTDSPVAEECQPLSAEPGRITLDSSCAVVHVVAGLPDPFDVFMDHPHPNPTSGVVHVKYDIPSEMLVRIELINMMGEQAALLTDSVQKVGRYDAVFNSRSISPGAYIVRMSAGGVVKSRQLMITQ